MDGEGAIASDLQLEPVPHYTAEDLRTFRRINLRPDANLASNRYEFANAFVQDLAREHGGCVVFDVGAGPCPMRRAVRAAGHDWRGFDLAPKDREVERWDLSEPATVAQRADAVLLLDVIEHLFNPGLAMKHIADVMKPNAPLLLTAPNPCWSRGRVHLLLRGTLAAFTQHDYDWNHHCFTPWPHVIEGLLREAGFTIERYVTLEGRTTWPRKLTPAFPFLLVEAAARKLVEARDATACGLSYGLIARRSSVPAA